MFSQFCRPGHYVVDVGANIGAHTLAFAHLVGERGRVFAFEPQRMVAQVLAANVALNSLTNVHTHHLGVGAEEGALWLADIDYSRQGNFGGVALDAVARPEGNPRPKYRVAVARLDDFYDQPRRVREQRKLLCVGVDLPIDAGTCGRCVNAGICAASTA